MARRRHRESSSHAPNRRLVFTITRALLEEGCEGVLAIHGDGRPLVEPDTFEREMEHLS
jgi:hypothetical protein